MKKILLFILTAVSFSLLGNAQATFSPASFTAEDEITITVDVTGSRATDGAPGMEGESEAYIWIWANTTGGEYTPNDIIGQWGESSAAAKMTHVEGNKWSFTFIPTTLFKRTAGELKSFGFLVKSKTGSKKSNDFKPFAFDPLVFTPAMLRIFPAKVGRDDVVNINFDKTLATTTNDQRMTPTSALVTMYDDAGAQVGAPLTLPVRKTSANTWTASFIPTRSFTADAGKKLKTFTYQFTGTVLNTTGEPTNVNTSTATVEFTEMK